ncbi:MAG: spermine synthase [Verrucomicrobiales bacterium]|nr:spermine synthase [Verrucomicrobiales bacterium]
MKPHVQLAEVTTASGTHFSLHQHDGKFYLNYNGNELMSSDHTYSEELLAKIGCAALLKGKNSRPAHPRILIGGLGMGFTLKRALELVPPPATVEVAELIPELVEWNRTFLVEHNGPLLDDQRTKIYHGDLFDCLSRANKNTYDALLLDIDNTPDDLITPANERLYTPDFLATIRKSLKPSGCVAYWLSEPAPQFKKKLRKAHFDVEEFAAKPHENSKRARHCIYVARPRREPPK